MPLFHDVLNTTASQPIITFLNFTNTEMSKVKPIILSYFTLHFRKVKSHSLPLFKTAIKMRYFKQNTISMAILNVITKKTLTKIC